MQECFYQWVDLDGEGIPGFLTEQADGWFYKRNFSPVNSVRYNDSVHLEARFAPGELVASKPAVSLAGHAQFMDLAGDGQPDLVMMDGPVRGFYERTQDEDWETFRPFGSWPNVDTRDPNLKFIDLDGDGHGDILVTEDDALTRYPRWRKTASGRHCARSSHGKKRKVRAWSLLTANNPSTSLTFPATDSPTPSESEMARSAIGPTSGLRVAAAALKSLSSSG